MILMDDPVRPSDVPELREPFSHFKTEFSILYASFYAEFAPLTGQYEMIFPLRTPACKQASDTVFR